MTVETFRSLIGAVAGFFFFATIFIGWIMMVIIPVISGGQVIANMGLLTTYTVASLIVMRVAGGPGWGIAAPEASVVTSVGAGLSNFAAPRLPTDDLGQSSTLPPDWASALTRLGMDGQRVAAVVNSANFPSGGRKVLPLPSQVFRAFHLTPLAGVRVVVLGQDPYAQRGRANGLAFSGAKGPAPASLDSDVPHSLVAQIGVKIRPSWEEASFTPRPSPAKFGLRPVTLVRAGTTHYRAADSQQTTSGGATRNRPRRSQACRCLLATTFPFGLQCRSPRTCRRKMRSLLPQDNRCTLRW